MSCSLVGIRGERVRRRGRKWHVLKTSVGMMSFYTSVDMKLASRTHHAADGNGNGNGNGKNDHVRAV